jgi:hypothetical protein
MFWSKPKKPKLTIEVQNDECGHIYCYWPKVKTDEEAGKMAQSVAALIVTSIRFEVMQSVINGVLTYGATSGMESIGRAIVMLINKAMTDGVSDEPLIKPSEAFSK